MSTENQRKNYDGQNRCRRCDRPLSDPNDIYGRRCAEIVGIDNYQRAEDILDENDVKTNSFNLSKYLTNDMAYTRSNTNSTTQVSFLPTTSREEASAIITNNATAIINAGSYYGVNPAIIAACIFTEQVTNVNILDALTDVSGYFLDTSIGIGQVKVSTAKMLEDEGYIQKTEYVGTKCVRIGVWNYYTDVWYAPAYGKIQGSREKAIAHRLTVESENINYVAAYLRYFQDRWKKVYPDIDGKTDILATLYNLGENANLPNANPKPNIFGIDAKNEYYYMRQLLGLY